METYKIAIRIDDGKIATAVEFEGTADKAESVLQLIGLLDLVKEQQLAKLNKKMSKVISKD